MGPSKLQKQFFKTKKTVSKKRWKVPTKYKTVPKKY